MVTATRCGGWSALIAVTSLPLFVTILFRGLPGVWQHRHRLVLWWLRVRHALFPGRQTLEELARWTPGSITVWRLRRVLKAADGESHLLGAWWVEEALQPLPPPQDGTLALVGDGRVKPPRGTQTPWAHTGRKSEHQPGCCGRRVAWLRANWDVERLPVAGRLMRPTSSRASQPEQGLLRALVRHCRPPPWAKRLLVEGDAADGSQDTMPLVQKREAAAPDRRWGFVCALARPWTPVEEKALQAWVTDTPRPDSQRPRGPRRPGAHGSKTCWLFRTRLGLRHIGDVTGVLRNKGRNVGPTQTKSLVPTLDEGPPRQGGCA